MTACVIIPTYNEETAIGNLAKAVMQTGLTAVVIDDGSTDNTSRIAQANGAVVLRNEKNQGKGASLARGFAYALFHEFDAVITMDGDGQHSAGDILKFLETASFSESKIFIGNRMARAGNMPFIRLVTNRFMSWLISRVIRQNIPDSQCGMRLIKKEVLEKVRLKKNNFEAESEFLIRAARLKFKIESINIDTIYAGEKSRINPFVDTVRFIKFIIKEL